VLAKNPQLVGQLASDFSKVHRTKFVLKRINR